MYADLISAGRKRSIRDRLDGDDYVGRSRSRPEGAKRTENPLLSLVSSSVSLMQRQTEDKWKHDLYDDAKRSASLIPKVGPGDLRFRLQKKGSRDAYQGGKMPGVRDLRERLSGIMHTQPLNAVPPKAKPVSESTKLVKKSAPSIETPVPESKKNPNTTSRKKTQKSYPSVDGLLQSLGLEKYLIMFKAEEVDMAALRHMSDEDLKTLGVPMGPRKKILQALDSRA